MAEHEQMEERALGLWRRFHFPLIIIVLTVLSGIVGFTYKADKRESARLVAGDALFGVHAAVADGDIESAQELFAQMDINDFDSMRHLAAFALAGLLANEGRAEEAAALLTEVADNDEDRGVRQMAQLRLAEIHINSGKSAEAISLLDAAIPASGRMRILFLERMGDASFAAGDSAEALSSYTQAAEEASREFPPYLSIIRIKTSALLSQQTP